MMKVRDRDSLMAFVKEAEAALTKYGLWDEITHPYPNCAVTAKKIISDCKDYDRCTKGSKTYVIQLAEGFRPILEAWIKYADLPKIKVRVKANGNVVEIAEKDLDMFGDLVELI